MKVVYPYNEILPKQAAHDLFIFSECSALAELGIEATLLCGKGSLEDEALCRHYQASPFSIKRLPIVRKNNPLNLSWNYPFFASSQLEIRRRRPDWVFLSVRKQGAYHLKRKIPGVRYLYEVHELAYYPYMKEESATFRAEREMLQQADLVTVTTAALKEILTEPPYSLSVPIEVVPLAVKRSPLPPPIQKPLTLMYVGQLYAGQGISTLLRALSRVKEIRLKIVGGKPQEIEKLKKIAGESEVEFLGFIPPSKLDEVAQEADAFVAPFDRSERMPYVAHTKLFEYAQWGRPFIAPDLPVVREHFSQEDGVLLYKPESVEELAAAIEALIDEQLRSKLQEAVKKHRDRYSWPARAKRYQKLFQLL